MLYIFAVNYYILRGAYSDENHNSHGHGILAYKCGEIWFPSYVAVYNDLVYLVGRMSFCFLAYDIKQSEC